MDKKFFFILIFTLFSNTANSGLVPELSKLLNINLDKAIFMQLKTNFGDEEALLHLVQKHEERIKSALQEILQKFNLTKDNLYKAFLGISIKNNNVTIINHESTSELHKFLHNLACYSQKPQNLEKVTLEKIFYSLEKENIKVFFADEYVNTAGASIKHIFLNRTFWEKLSTPEKLAVLHHEMNHIKNNDVIKMLLAKFLYKSGFIQKNDFYNYRKDLEKNADIQTAQNLKNSSGLILFIKKTTADKYHPLPEERISYLQKI